MTKLIHEDLVKDLIDDLPKLNNIPTKNNDSDRDKSNPNSARTPRETKPQNKLHSRELSPKKLLSHRSNQSNSAAGLNRTQSNLESSEVTSGLPVNSKNLSKNSPNPVQPILPKSLRDQHEKNPSGTNTSSLGSRAPSTLGNLSRGRYPSSGSLISNTTQIVRKTYDPKSGLMVPIHKLNSKNKSGGPPKSNSSIYGSSQATLVAERVASAKRKKQNELINQNVILAQKNEDQKREISILKQIQRRQENSLNKYENIDEDLPRLLDQHAEQRRVDKAAIRNFKQKERTLEATVATLRKDILNKESLIERMTNIVEDKSLRDADELKKKLTKMEREFEFLKVENEKLKKNTSLQTGALERQLKLEKTKSYQLIKEIDNYRKLNIDMASKLKANERALNDLNVYKSKLSLNSRSSSREDKRRFISPGKNVVHDKSPKPPSVSSRASSRNGSLVSCS